MKQSIFLVVFYKILRSLFEKSLLTWAQRHSDANAARATSDQGQREATPSYSNDGLFRCSVVPRIRHFDWVLGLFGLGDPVSRNPNNKF